MSTLLAMRGTQLLAPVPPQVAAQVNLVNSVTRDIIFTRVSQSDEKALKTGDDEIVVLNRAANFMVHCEGNADQICIRLDDELTNTAHLTFPVSVRSRLAWTTRDKVSQDAHVTFHAGDGHVLAFVDPAHAVSWYVGEWIPRAQEAAYKLADPGFRNAPNPPDSLQAVGKKQTWTPWYTSPQPTPNATPLGSPYNTPPGSPDRYAPAPEAAHVMGDGVAPSHAVPEVVRRQRMDMHVQENIREMVSMLYTAGTELRVLQKLQMLISVEPMLLCRADTLTILRQILEKTSDAGTARQAIVFADEYLHIHEVVHACNALGLYQLMEFGFKPARAAPDAVTRNKATAVVKHILDQRGDLRQRPRPPPKRLAPPDTTTFMGKFGAVQQPLGITAVEEAAARRPPPAKTGEAEAWLDFMRTTLEKRGSSTQKMLAIRFKVMDNDKKGGVNKEEFEVGMLEMGAPVSADIVDCLFEYYTFGSLTKEGEELNFEQFIVLVRGYLNANRRALVQQAFRRMDRNGSGMIDWHDVKDVYSVAQHPKVITGELTEEQALTAFLSKYGDEGGFANGDGKISLQEFEQYYANISASIDTDDYFRLMMQQAWRI